MDSQIVNSTSSKDEHQQTPFFTVSSLASALSDLDALARPESPPIEEKGSRSRTQSGVSQSSFGGGAVSFNEFLGRTNGESPRKSAQNPSSSTPPGMSLPPRPAHSGNTAPPPRPLLPTSMRPVQPNTTGGAHPPFRPQDDGHRKVERRSSSCLTVFEAILRYGHDEDFEPFGGDNFFPTDAPAGSAEKIEVLRKRVELGQPLWHPDDRVDYAGLTGVIRPRDDE